MRLPRVGDKLIRVGGKNQGYGWSNLDFDKIYTVVWADGDYVRVSPVLPNYHGYLFTNSRAIRLYMCKPPYRCQRCPIRFRCFTERAN